MKNKKVLYLITTILTLFSFNMNVKAEPNVEIKSHDGKTTSLSCSAFARMTNEIGFESMALEKLDTSKYDITCIYALDISYSYHIETGQEYGQKYKNASGCHVIQFSVNRNGDLLINHSLPGEKIAGYVVSNDVYDFKKAIENNGGMCPQNIYSYVSPPEPGAQNNSCTGPYVECKDSTTATSPNEDPGVTGGVTLEETSGYEKLPLGSASGYNWITGKTFSIDNTKDNLIGDKINISDCTHLFSGAEGEDLLEILKWVVSLFKIGIPILLIGLGIMDFVKAVFAGKEDEMKKAQAKFIKRVIIGVCIYLIPTLISYILKIYNHVWDKNINTDFCGILK